MLKIRVSVNNFLDAGNNSTIGWFQNIDVDDNNHDESTMGNTDLVREMDTTRSSSTTTSYLGP